jgi:glucose/arabinose dehydrogenase
MQIARQFITAAPIATYFRMWSPSIPRASLAAAIIAALATCVLPFAPAVFAQPASDSFGQLLVGKAAFGDWRTDAPLVRRKITDLPPPYATRSVSNPPRVIAKPISAAPKVPPGFQVELFASDLRDPRTVRVAPNGDIFVAESEPGRIRVLRAADGAARPSSSDVFASGLDQPFGIAFYPSAVLSIQRHPQMPRQTRVKSRGSAGRSLQCRAPSDRSTWTSKASNRSNNSALR